MMLELEASTAEESKKESPLDELSMVSVGLPTTVSVALIKRQRLGIGRTGTVRHRLFFNTIKNRRPVAGGF